jgi:hypothetical protein
LLVFASAAVLFAQSDRGTVTGTVAADPTGAMIPGAKVALTNQETDVRFETVTTGTGNYTLASLPVGAYRLSVEAAGFSRFEQANIRVQVAVTTRLDVSLQVGQAVQTVEVVARASMLKTESAEQSTTVSGTKINSLPINFGIGAGAIRNPLSFTQLTPGANISGWNTIKVNGAPTGTFRILFEGQESSSGLDARVSDEVQPSVEAIEEFTLQTSNFAAEFGLVAGGLFNFTSKSGTNQFHGGAYIYMVNTAFNAGIPNLQTIPSIKIDHSLTSAARITGYYSQQNTEKDVGQDGLPDPISIRRDLYILGRTVRVNYDHTITPTLLLHLGAGVQRYRNPLPAHRSAGQQCLRRHGPPDGPHQPRPLPASQAHRRGPVDLGARQPHLQDRRRVEDRHLHQPLRHRPEPQPRLQHRRHLAEPVRADAAQRNQYRLFLGHLPAGPV